MDWVGTSIVRIPGRLRLTQVAFGDGRRFTGHVRARIVGSEGRSRNPALSHLAYESFMVLGIK